MTTLSYMRVEAYRGGSSHAGSPVLVLSREELDRLIDDSADQQDFYRRRNALAIELGYTHPVPHQRPEFERGERALRLALDTVSVGGDGLADEFLCLGTFSGRAKEDPTGKTCHYLRQGRGFFVRLQMHSHVG